MTFFTVITLAAFVGIYFFRENDVVIGIFAALIATMGVCVLKWGKARLQADPQAFSKTSQAS